MLNIPTLTSNTVTVLIGANGSGKSRLLREISLQILGGYGRVIAIAPTIFDRFRGIKGKRYKFFGARNGRGAATKAIRNALDRALSENPQVLKNFTRALAYTGFDPVIGIRFVRLNLDAFGIAASQLTSEEAERLHSALLKWKTRSAYEPGGFVRFELSEGSFRELDALSYAVIAKHDELLYKSGVTARIEYFFFRGKTPIPILEACSGELSFITTVAFIATEICPGSVIVIDEPETSLHPTWQKSYIATLLDLFHYYNPRIVISTHSPIIISGAEATSGQVTVYEMKDQWPQVFEYANLSLEEMYDRLFDLITPKNHYLSQRAVALLNDLNSGSRDFDQVVHELEGLRAKSYDKSQMAVIDKFEDLASKLQLMRERRRE